MIFVSFILLKLFIESQGGALEISYSITHSSLDNNGAVSPSYISFAVTIFSAVISTFMVETLLRGLVLQTANKHLRFYAANTIAVVLTVIDYLQRCNLHSGGNTKKPLYKGIGHNMGLSGRFLYINNGN